MRIENSTLTKTAAKAVVRTNPASKREARRAQSSRRRSISPAAVTSRMPARAALGMKRASGAKSTTTTATAAAANTPDKRLTAPAWKLMAERVSDPEPGKHWKKPPPRLASPSARHCRL